MEYEQSHVGLRYLEQLVREKATEENCLEMNQILEGKELKPDKVIEQVHTLLHSI